MLQTVFLLFLNQCTFHGWFSFSFLFLQHETEHYVIQTALQAADAQRLSCVQREPMVAVLDVRLAGHWIEVGLQGEL